MPMDPDRRNEADQLFQSALSLPVDQRTPFLRQACVHDDSLMREVQSLLAAHENGETSKFPMGPTVLHYRILEKLGEGGMGVVYKAVDTKLDRMVALKFLPPSMRHNEEVKRRLTPEAGPASELNHPNILV